MREINKPLCQAADDYAISLDTASQPFPPTSQQFETIFLHHVASPTSAVSFG